MQKCMKAFKCKFCQDLINNEDVGHRDMYFISDDDISVCNKGTGILSFYPNMLDLANRKLCIETGDIQAAEIFGDTAVKAGEDIHLRCSITERKPPRALIHMYLCKNGVGVRMELLDNQLDHVFLLSNVSVLDSGTYTCVYSLNKQSLRNVSPRGNSSVHVQVTDDSSDTRPAHIVGDTAVKAGEKIELQCSISDREATTNQLHMYLCKDRAGVRMEMPGEDDSHTFILKNVTVLESGNYSCVYSFKEHPLDNVCISALQSIHVQVTDDVRPAHIVGSTTVKAGDNIQLNCSISDRGGTSNQLHMYLCKNRVGVRMEMPGDDDLHTFILKNVTVLESGNYSCVYSFKELPLDNVCISGIKSIHVQVTDDRPAFGYFMEILVGSLAVVLLIGLISLATFYCRVRKRCNLCRNRRQSEDTFEDDKDDDDAINAN
ncbi:hypothetical protein NFI96_033204, partial [Prochilodus magdalenae]